MAKGIKIYVVLALIFSLSIMTIGYARFSDTLSITGSAEVEVPRGLMIVDVQVKGSPTRLDVYEAKHDKYTTTVKADLSKTISNQSGSVKYTITVLNNTKYEYAYRGLYFQSDLAGYNNNLVVSGNGTSNQIGVKVEFENNVKVVPANGGVLKFDVTYNVGSNRTTFAANKTIKTMLNYQFGINVETEEAAIEAVHSKFEDIMNTSSTYQELIENLDNKFDGQQEWTSNYIGNVGDANADDAVIVNTLFSGQLQIVVNGVATPARVIIKHENLDNNTSTGDDYVAVNESNGGVFRGYGCEMTMYFTIDALNRPNGTAPVYVTVYTCDRDANGNIRGEWYQIGDTYFGYAPIVSYNGTAGGTGSFITDDWVAETAIHTLTDSYSYSVPDEATIKQLVQVTDPLAVRQFERLVVEVKDLIDDMTYAGTGIEFLEKDYETASRLFVKDENGRVVLDESGYPILIDGLTRARLCPIIKKMNYSLIEARKIIDALDKPEG